MKKLMIAMIALALCLALCGCLDQTEQIPGDNTEPVPGETTGTAINKIPDEKPYEKVEEDADDEIVGPSLPTYAEFIAKSPEDQQAFMNSFGTDLDGIQRFMAWYTDAKAAYDADRESQENGDGSIDIGDYVDKELENPQ